MKYISFYLLTTCLLISTTLQASPTIYTLDSDAAFLATPFNKIGGANVRWGNSAANGDWEYSVVNGSDIPIGVGNPQQHAWNLSAANYLSPFFTYSSTGQLDLDLQDGSPVSTGMLTGDVNALFIRANAAVGKVASMEFLYLETTEGVFNLGSLFGDSNAEYIAVIDSNLANGFTLVSEVANLQSGVATGGSNPMYQIKIGSVAVPEPSTYILLGSLLLPQWFLRKKVKAGFIG